MSPAGWVAALPWRARRKARHLATKALLERRGPAAIRLAPNIWEQDPRASLADVLGELGPEPVRPAGPLRIAHVVNPFTAARGSAHERAQAATLASMRRAKGLAGDGLAVDLVAVRHVDDALSGLDGFVMAPPVTRTVLDVASFAKPRPLPILSDILERGVAASPDADLIVYTNVDINVVPHFYEAVRALRRCGIDAMIINRRTVAAAYDGDGAAADWALASSDPGGSHPGIDCLVFPRRDFESYVPSLACVGMPPMDRSLLYNMVARAERMAMLTNVQMTYHFGDDRDWGNGEFRDYHRFNLAECRAVVDAYRANPACFARLGPFLAARSEYENLHKAWGDQDHKPATLSGTMGWVGALRRRARRKARHLAAKVLLGRPGPPLVRFAPNTWKQDVHANLADVLTEVGPEAMPPAGQLKIAHIVNPFTAPLDSEHERAQTAALASMRRAKGLAGDGLVVDLVAVRHVDDVFPGLDDFIMAPPLTRTVLDVASFAKPRPLPILSDILERGVAASPDADLIVYTNVDINVAPHFYEAVRALWRRGFDAMTINRRTLAAAYQGNSSGAEWMLAAADHGKSHDGFDCFVFPRRDFESYVPSLVCVGMPAVDRPLLYNMVAWAERMVMLTNVQMTYHFGHDRVWRSPHYHDYFRFNVAECRAVVQAYRVNPASFARLGPFLQMHNEYEIFRRVDAGFPIEQARRSSTMLGASRIVGR